MISTVVYYALVIAVRADYPAKTLGELIALAKEKPGALSFGSVGFGSTHHLAGEMLKNAAGIDMVHVPYRGDSQAIAALLAGDVPVIIGTSVLLAPQIESGSVRGLAVTSSTRSKLLPNVPSAAEAGLKDFDVRTWAGLIAPKGTPVDVVARLNGAVQASSGGRAGQGEIGGRRWWRGPRQHPRRDARSGDERNQEMECRDRCGENSPVVIEALQSSHSQYANTPKFVQTTRAASRRP